MSIPTTAVLLAATILPGAALGPSAGPPNDSPPRPEVDVRALAIEEQRYRTFGDAESHRSEPTTTLTIELSGQELAGVTHWFGLKIDTAKDDVRTDLRIDHFGQDAGGDTPEEIDREHMWFFEDEPPTDRLKLDLVLGMTPRRASELALVEGSVMLRRATLETIAVTDLRGADGDSVDDPRLKKADVVVRIGDVTDSSIEITVRGELGAVTGFRLVDGDGTDLSNGSSSWSSNREKSLTIDFDELPRGAHLEFDVVTDSEDLRVPFRLEDLELP